MYEEFGEVIVSKGDKFPKGLVLRSKPDYTVVLELYMDAFMQNVDVLHDFGKSYSLEDDEDLEYCLSVARNYERNLEEPIHIFIANQETSKTAVSNDTAAQIARIVKWNRTRDWSIQLPIRN